MSGTFVYNNGVATLLHNVNVAGIDAAGAAVGTTTSNGGFVDAGGTIAPFQVAGAKSLIVGGASDGANEIFGDYVDGSGLHHSFLIDLSPAAPTITGTVHGQTTTAEASVTPCSGVTIADAKTGATETLTITLAGPGTLADGTAFGGLSHPSASTYALSGTAPR